MFRSPVIPAVVPALILAGSGLTLGAAFAFQHVGGYEPCPLCLYQRWPHAVAVVLSLAALILLRRDRDRWARALVTLCGAGLVVGAGIAAYHVGIEQAWWLGPTSCTSGGAGADSVEALLAQIEAAPVVLCDVVQWRFLGFTMAGYNFLLSLGLAVLSLWPKLWAVLPGRMQGKWR